MKASRLRRLEAAGWVLGDAEDFLDLDAQERALLELRLALARELRDRRRSRGTTQLELARRLGSSQSRVAKMEAGDASVSSDLLLRSLLALGATFRELGAVLSALPQPRSSRAGRARRSRGGARRVSRRK